MVSFGSHQSEVTWCSDPLAFLDTSSLRDPFWISLLEQDRVPLVCILGHVTGSVCKSWINGSASAGCSVSFSATGTSNGDCSDSFYFPFSAVVKRLGTGSVNCLPLLNATALHSLGFVSVFPESEPCCLLTISAIWEIWMSICLMWLATLYLVLRSLNMLFILVLMFVVTWFNSLPWTCWPCSNCCIIMARCFSSSCGAVVMIGAVCWLFYGFRFWCWFPELLSTKVCPKKILG